jgi:lipoprotein-anchoring transpeptidase ErfK/SrfK
VRSKSFAIFAGLLVLLLGAGATGVYAYDKSREEVIAEGVTVSGVPVGGLERAAARDKLEAALLEPLKEPVTVRYKQRRFRLTPAQAKVGVDLDRSVDRAVARSRRGNVLFRTVRDLRGQTVDADVDVDIRYSRKAIRRLVDRVSGEIDKPAKDAKVSFTTGSLERTPSRTGRRVRTALLRREVNQALLTLEGSRSVRVKTRTIQPDVTSRNVVKKYPAVLIVDRPNFRINLYKNLKLDRSYGIALGKAGNDTPSGLYSIQNKQVDPIWNVPNSDWAGELAGTTVPGGVPENPLKARWMGVYNGVGIHGTADEGSIGSNASHGCIRMRVAEVKELYDEVPVGAPIYIS